MRVGRTPTIRQLCPQMDDYKSYFDLLKGRPGGVKDAKELGNVSGNSPGADLSLHRSFDVLQSFKGQIIPGGHQAHYITKSSQLSFLPPLPLIQQEQTRDGNNRDKSSLG